MPGVQRMHPATWRLPRLSGDAAHAGLPRQRGEATKALHLAYIGVWALAFGAMSASGSLGDRHPGQWVPFWQQACAPGRPGACWQP